MVRITTSLSRGFAQTLQKSTTFETELSVFHPFTTRTDSIMDKSITLSLGSKLRPAVDYAIGPAFGLKRGVAGYMVVEVNVYQRLRLFVDNRVAMFILPANSAVFHHALYNGFLI